VRERGKPFGFGRLRRSAGPYLQRLGEKVRIAQPGRSRRTIPTGPATCRLSDVVVTTGCHALAPSQLATLHPDCERFRGAGAPVRLGRARLGRHQPSRTAARHLAVCGDSEGCPSKPKCSSTPFIVSISQRARASPRLLGNFGRLVFRVVVSGFASSHTLLGCDRPAAHPMGAVRDLPLRDVTRAKGSGKLGSLPCFVSCKALGCRRVFRACVGRSPLATPVHSTDVCSSRILISK
jgi:hypothetical protein